MAIEVPPVRNAERGCGVTISGHSLIVCWQLESPSNVHRRSTPHQMHDCRKGVVQAEQTGASSAQSVSMQEKKKENEKIKKFFWFSFFFF
jgi:hypothetical protein